MQLLINHETVLTFEELTAQNEAETDLKISAEDMEAISRLKVDENFFGLWPAELYRIS